MCIVIKFHFKIVNKNITEKQYTSLFISALLFKCGVSQSQFFKPKCMHCLRSRKENIRNNQIADVS